MIQFALHAPSHASFESVAFPSKIPFQSKPQTMPEGYLNTNKA